MAMVKFEKNTHITRISNSIVHPWSLSISTKSQTEVLSSTEIDGNVAPSPRLQLSLVQWVFYDVLRVMWQSPIASAATTESLNSTKVPLEVVFQGADSQTCLKLSVSQDLSLSWVMLFKLCLGHNLWSTKILKLVTGTS